MNIEVVKKRVLGIDPGTIQTGFALLDYDSRVQTYIASGTIRLLPEEGLDKRLFHLMSDLEEIIHTYQPEELALESVFFAKNAQSSLKIGYARGVVLAMAAKYKMSLHEYAPTQIKSSLCGNGRAPKDQIARLVRLLLGFKPDFAFGSPDQSDALAICLTHAQTRLKRTKSYDRSSQWKNTIEDPDSLRS